MEFGILWLILCILVGVYASSKGRSGFGYFILSAFLSPLLGIIIVLILGPKADALEDKAISAGDVRKCPFCAELIKTEALVCKHCGKDVPKAAYIEAPQNGISSAENGTWQIIIGICLIILFLTYIAG
jgi:hypothetical protein